MATTPLQVAWLCQRLKHLRQMKRISTTVLAEKLSVSRTRISDFESARYDPQLGTCIRITEALGVTFEAIVEGMPECDGTPRLHSVKELTTWLRSLGFSVRAAGGIVADAEFTDMHYRLAMRHPELKEDIKGYLEDYWSNSPNNHWKRTDL